MTFSIDMDSASSTQIEAFLCEQIARLRLSRNMPQRALARAAGISVRTVRRLEAGEGVSLDTFLRVLIGLGIQGNVAALIPDPGVRPLERLRNRGKQRQRARPLKDGARGREWTWSESDD